MPLPRWEWASYEIERDKRTLTIEVLYSLAFDAYEGTTWVDIHKIFPYVDLTQREKRIFCEEVLGD